MRKLAILLVLGGLPLPAMAADIVTVQCNSFGNTVSASQASAGVTLPASCAANATNCSQCIADTLSKGFKLENTVGVSGGTPGPQFAFFVLQRGGGD